MAARRDSDILEELASRLAAASPGSGPGGVRSSAASSCSEERDVLSEASRVHDELERKSNASSYSSKLSSARQSAACAPEGGDDVDHRSDAGSSSHSIGTADSAQALYRSIGAAGLASGALVAPEERDFKDKVALALREAKHARQRESSSSGSGVASSSSHTGGTGGSKTSSSFGGLVGGSTKAKGSVSSALIPYSVMAALSEEDRTTLMAAMAEIMQQTGGEVADMEEALRLSKTRADRAEDDGKLMEDNLAVLRSQLGKDHALEEALLASRAATDKATDARDCLHDKLAGLQALLDMKVVHHHEALADLKSQSKDAAMEQKSKSSLEHNRLEGKLAAATQQLKKAANQRIAHNSERAVQKRKEELSEKKHEGKVDHLESELYAAIRELSRLKADSATPWQCFEEVREMEAKLQNSQDNNLKLNADLSDLRLSLLNDEQRRENEAKAAQASAEVSNLLGPAVGSRRFKAGGHGKAALKAPALLSAIDEEDQDEDLASQAASNISGQVSSTADNVADLNDFDHVVGRDEATARGDADKVEWLRTQMLASQGRLQDFKDEKTLLDAENSAKVSRLWNQMNEFREEAAASQDEVSRLKQKGNDKGGEDLEQTSKVRLSDDGANTRVLQDQIERLQSLLDDKDKHLHLALEANRIANLRLQDTKREMESMELRHAQTVKDMQVRLSLYGGGNATEMEEAEADLVCRLRSLESERNVLRNDFESQKVSWQMQLEHQQQQTSNAEVRLKETDGLLQSESALRRRALETSEERERGLREALAGAERQAAELRALALSASTSWLSLLRCPSRSQPGPAAAMMAVHGAVGSGAVPCQALVWRIVSAIGKVTALLCASGTLQVKESSKQAQTLWGSGQLRRCSLSQLLFDDATRQWLEVELSGTGDETNFFAPRQLGCVEFRNRLGAPFDASVFYAWLPAEDAPPNQRRPPAMLVVVEPLVDETVPAAGGRGQRLQEATSGGRPPGRRATSVASSVRSEDITANDSVSNVGLHCLPRPYNS